MADRTKSQRDAAPKHRQEQKARRVFVSAGFLAGFVSTAPLSAAAPAANTSVPNIDEINVTAVRGKDRALQPALIMDEQYFKRTIPTDFTQVFRGVLGVGIRTNSRGEAVLRLRSSQELELAGGF